MFVVANTFNMVSTSLFVSSSVYFPTLRTYLFKDGPIANHGEDEGDTNLNIGDLK